MNKRILIAAYVISDWLTGAASWTVLFTYRKVRIESALETTIWDVMDLSQIGHHPFQMGVGTIDLNEALKPVTRILPQRPNLFHHSHRALVATNDQGWKTPLSRMDPFNRARGNPQTTGEGQKPVAQNEHAQRCIILLVTRDGIIQQ